MKISSVRIGVVPDKDVDRLNDPPKRPVRLWEILLDAAVLAGILGGSWLMLIGLDRVMQAWGI